MLDREEVERLLSLAADLIASAQSSFANEADENCEWDVTQAGVELMNIEKMFLDSRKDDR